MVWKFKEKQWQNIVTSFVHIADSIESYFSWWCSIERNRISTFSKAHCCFSRVTRPSVAFCMRLCTRQYLRVVRVEGLSRFPKPLAVIISTFLKPLVGRCCLARATRPSAAPSERQTHAATHTRRNCMVMLMVSVDKELFSIYKLNTNPLVARAFVELFLFRNNTYYCCFR